jgi:hypothetical protein
MYICIRGIDFESLFMIFRLYYGIDQRLWYALLFILPFQLMKISKVKKSQKIPKG